MVLTTKNAAGLIAGKKNNPSAPVQVEIVRPTKIAGRIASVGQVVDVSPADARVLIHAQKAVPISKAQAVENREKDLTARTSTRGGKARMD